MKEEEKRTPFRMREGPFVSYELLAAKLTGTGGRIMAKVTVNEGGQDIC